MNFKAKNILVINFGQIGDVVLSLPAMQAIRRRFPDSSITALVGKSAEALVETAGLFDKVLSVDRVALRDGSKFRAIRHILSLVSKIRRRRFDLVIDLHSLHETNLLGFLSGARRRLFADRGSRSLNFLSNFSPKPPAGIHEVHMRDFYLQTLSPLEIEAAAEHVFKLNPNGGSRKTVETRFALDKLPGKKLVGINLGAGNASRRWKLENFAALSKKLLEIPDARVLVFFGPEEKHLKTEIESKFPAETLIYDDFALPELMAAFAHLKVLIGNDTGPMHLGAVTGTPVVFVTHTPNFRPVGEKILIAGDDIEKTSVEKVFECARNFL